MSAIENQLIITGPQEGETLSVAGSNYRILLSGGQTDEKLAIIEMNVPPGSGPMPHQHPHFQESFYVLEGEIEVRTQDHRYIAQKDAMVTIPVNGPVHCFKNISGENARLLCIVTPAGLESFFKEIGKSIAYGTMPKETLSPEEKEKIKEAAIRHGQVLYPADYFDK